MISAKVIADSKNTFGNRITTMVVTFPRIILAEFNTHRMFSRNSASSRAIPFEKMVKSVKENPFIPIAWQKDHKGMQGNEYFDFYEGSNPSKNEILIGWLIGRDAAVNMAEYLNKKGVTKQLCNRPLESYMWHTVIVTATEWENFFALRCPQYALDVNSKGRQYFRSKKDFINYVGDNYEVPGTKQEKIDLYFRYNLLTELDWLKCNQGQAEIHMMALAEAMWDAYNESIPKQLQPGEWHIPFGDNINIQNLTGFNIDKFIEESKIKIATARCARISYTVVGEEGKPDNYENDIKLHDRLLSSGHMSPFEHCAQCMDEHTYYKSVNGQFTNYSKCDIKMISSLCNSEANIFGWSGNFRGWLQYRKMIPNENIV